MRSLILSLTVVAGLIAGTVYSNFGCGAVDAAFDCHAVCDRYKTCFDANYDVGACSSRCRTASGNDANYRSKADQCQACIDNKSCAAGTFACGIECGAIVP